MRAGLRRRAARWTGQRGQPAPVSLGVESAGPGGVVEDVLEHKGVHAHQGGLQDAQAGHGHLLLVAAVGRPAHHPCRSDHLADAVPRLDDVQDRVDLALQLPNAEMTGGEDRLLGAGRARACPGRWDAPRPGAGFLVRSLTRERHPKLTTGPIQQPLVVSQAFTEPGRSVVSEGRSRSDRACVRPRRRVRGADRAGGAGSSR